MCYSPKTKNHNESSPVPSRVGRSRGLCGPRRTQGVALVVVLSLVVIVSLILVAFVTTMMMDRTASASYGQSLAAEQIGQGAVNLVVAELRNEMGKDALPDLTYPNKPLYTNVSSANILPQKVGTNSAMPNLIKTSTGTAPFTGTLANGTLLASSVSTFAPSTNGRFMDANRWNAPFLGSFPNTASLPNWVIMTRSGATNTGSFGPTGNTLNNPAIDNKSFAIGRFAYAIYDVGGLLDITVAGHPTSLSVEQINQLKGTLAGADLTAVGITDVDALVKWRNAASAASTNAYFNYMTNFVSTNGFSKVAPGDTTFLGRQDLIKAAKLGIAGLSTGALTNLTTFTREKNAPSWEPRATIGSPLGNTIDYKALAKNLSTNVISKSTNVSIPYVRHIAPAEVNTYGVDGARTSYTVVPGDPLVSRRFPLDRIKWLGPNGPQNGGSEESIQACFGLLWSQTKGVWQYVGPVGNVEQASIKALAEIVAEKREPNFFELLQAGILTGSLGLEGHISQGAVFNTFNYYTDYQSSLAFHVFRIGASIISQYEASSLPIVIEFTPSTKPWQATGLDNLPYLNMYTVLAGADPSSTSSLQCYMMFGLWNPHQGVAGSRPPIRLRVKGTMTLANGYGDYSMDLIDNPPFVYGYPVRGYQLNLNETVMLSNGGNSGSNGFADPHVLFPSDLSPIPALGSSAGMEWAVLPPINGITYAGFRLPNYKIDMTRTPAAEDLVGGGNVMKTQLVWQYLWAWMNTDTSSPFNFWLEYQNAAGVWVPYNYHAGMNDSTLWFTKSPGFSVEYLGPAGVGATVSPLQALNASTGLSIFYYLKQLWESSDPRSLRFGATQSQTTNTTPAWTAFLNSSMWSTATDPAKQTFGRPGNQNAQKIFGPPWSPAGLARNNNLQFVPATAVSSPDIKAFASYKDRDGVRRISDSGLYPAGADLSVGNPYAVSTVRSSDRPIILNRPFRSVGELGYVSRDYPWRTLDFFTAESGDAGLLDIFTVNQSNESMLKGRINLNSQNIPAVTAVLNNAVAVPFETSPIPAVGSRVFTKPDAVAAKLVAISTSSSASSGPLAGRDEIATKLVANLSSPEFGSTDEQNIKSRREAVTRALADVGQTRTWNLLIDVVAQAGRYGPNAASLGDFVVEGERRFWLHVAIDRFTGEIIDKYLEPVSQ